MKGKKKKGFTLIELIIAIAVLVILTGLLAPQFMKYIEQARKVKVIHSLDNVYQAFIAGYVDAAESGRTETTNAISIARREPPDSGDLNNVDRAIYDSMKHSIGEEQLKNISIVAYFQGNEGAKKGDFYNFSMVIVRIHTSEDFEPSYFLKTGVEFNNKSIYGEAANGKETVWQE